MLLLKSYYYYNYSIILITIFTCFTCLFLFDAKKFDTNRDLQFASLGEFPSIVALYLDDKAAQHCLGILDNAIKVIIATSCFNGWEKALREEVKIKTRIHVIAGQLQFNESKVVPLNNKIGNKTRLYNGCKLTIITLETPIKETDIIKYAKFSDKELPKESECFTVGVVKLHNEPGNRTYYLAKEKAFTYPKLVQPAATRPEFKFYYFHFGVMYCTVNGQKLVAGVGAGGSSFTDATTREFINIYFKKSKMKCY